MSETIPHIIDNDLELDILQHIQRSTDGVRQRDLATIIGKSLGMTNAILHRLTEKGLLMVSRVNNRNISYVVTPYGMRELAGRSYRYFKRTIKNVVDYKDALDDELCARLQVMAKVVPADCRRELVLVGRSDLDFILEHLAHKYDLEWRVMLIDGSLADVAGKLSLASIVVWSEDFETFPALALVVPAIGFRDLVT